MPRKGHSPEQVLNKLRQVEVAVANGKSVGQAVHGRTALTRASTGSWGMNFWTARSFIRWRRYRYWQSGGGGSTTRYGLTADLDAGGRYL